MLGGSTNDIMMSQSIQDKEDNGEESSTKVNQQKPFVASEVSVASDERVYIQEQRVVSPLSSGRSSVVSDPGYISCTSDTIHNYSPESDNSSLDENIYNTPEYNAVISPCNNSIADVLNDTYEQATRNSPSSVESDDSNSLMPSPPISEVPAEQLEKSLWERAMSIQPNNRYNTTLSNQMSWPILQQRSLNSAQMNPGENYDQKSDLDVFFDGVIDGNSDVPQNSSIFSTQRYVLPQEQLKPSVSFVQAQGLDLSQGHYAPNTPISSKDLSVEDFSLSVEDFCFEDDILGCEKYPQNNNNMQQDMHHHSNRTMSPSSEFSCSDMQSPQRPHQVCTPQFVGYQDASYDFSPRVESSALQAARRSQARVFAKTSEENLESVSRSNTEQKQSRNTTPTTAEEEAWRSYLENPLTAATTALMSIHGDEDSAAALGLLYDYYKVPREKRLLSYPTNVNEIAQPTPNAFPRNTEATSITSGLVPSVQKVAPISVNSTGLLKTVDAAGLRSVKNEQNSNTSSAFGTVGQRTADGNKVKKEIVLDSPQDLSNAFTNLDGKLVTSRGYVSGVTSSPSNIKSNSNTFSAASLTSGLPYNSRMPESVNISQRSHLGIKKSEYSSESFEYIMEAPRSLKQKESDPTMSYINKGQFYCITLRNTDNELKFKSQRVKSVVHIVFGDGKPEEEQLRHWKYWHARQHTVKQRIIDIADYKESSMIYDIEEIGHNAISFSWNVNEIAKIFVSCNCLSTDFSAQKGIKGLPLLIQIDTYVDGQEIPSHRGQCQIKVFCDKGAERKIRDEERKATKRRQKNTKQSGNTASASSNMLTIAATDLKQMMTSQITSSTQPGQSALKRTDYVIFKSINDVASRPVLFIPEVQGHGSVSYPVACTPSTSPCASPVTSPRVGQLGAEPESSFFTNPNEIVERGLKRAHSEDERGPATKTSRFSNPDTPSRVLLYVRQANEEVYDGLMLKQPDLNGLKQAIEEKYNCSAEKINKVFKKSKKGIMVRMDDNIIRHYSNEDTFVIDIQSETINDVTYYKVTLTEV